MRNKPFMSYTSFKELGGYLIDKEILYEEIAKLPLRESLAYLSFLSKQYFEAPGDKVPSFYNPTRQGIYLNLAIVDDFPISLPNAAKMYCPGKVPVTGERHLFIHAHNIAFLTHSILLLNHKPKKSYELDYELPRRICRLLLIINDYLADENLPTGDPNTWSISQRRDWIDSWLRQFQYNKYHEWHKAFVLLSRYSKFYSEYLPPYFPDLHTKFMEATKGISSERYFTIMAQILTHIYFGITIDRLFWKKNTFSMNIKESERVHFDKMIDKWTLIPVDYLSNKEIHSSVFDYTTLKIKPLVEVGKEELICPNYEYLVDKIIDEPFYILTDYLNTQNGCTAFHTSFGKAYEDYVNSLIRNIAGNDLKGAWYYETNILNEKEEEIADAILQKDSTIIYFEHKAKRLSLSFLTGGSGSQRVIGPDKSYFEETNKGIILDYKAMRQNDKALITHGMWQQNSNIEELIGIIEHKRDIKITKVIPIITILPEIRVDEVIYIMYLKPLIDLSGLYSRKEFYLPQYLQISDLEKLARVSISKKLNIEQLFDDKNEITNVYRRFDIYLSEKKLNIVPDLTDAISIMDKAKNDFTVNDIN